MATQEFVVPRSMPITRSILSLSHHRAVEPSGLAAFEPTYPVSDGIILGRQRRGALEFSEGALLHAGRLVNSGQSDPGLGVLRRKCNSAPCVLARETQVGCGHQAAVSSPFEDPGGGVAQGRAR